MAPRELAYEALSAITGCNIKSIDEFKLKNPGISAPIPQTPQDIINLALFSNMEGFLQQLLKGFSTLSVGGPWTEAALIRKELFINEEDFFDPQYDYDFTHINDRAAQFKRGNEPYKRPCGWNRIALKVLDKYKDGNRWLGTGPEAWPVSYHGTSIEGAKGIIESYYKPGPREVFGRGIYSAPDLETAFVFSKTFTSESTNKTYNVILQNRINPRKRQRHNEYWLVPVPEGTSPADEKAIVESAIRPYGLLLKEK